jgi:hypothetical protein
VLAFKFYLSFLFWPVINQPMELWEILKDPFKWVSVSKKQTNLKVEFSLPFILPKNCFIFEFKAQWFKAALIQSPFRPSPQPLCHEIFIHCSFIFAGLFFSLTCVLSLSLVATFLALIIFFAAAGNILVCVAIYTERSLRRIGNLFLASLAIADMFIALFVMIFAGFNDILGEKILKL